jgi:hypothetical protein
MGLEDVTPEMDENPALVSCLLSQSSLSDGLTLSQGLQQGGKVIKCFA